MAMIQGIDGSALLAAFRSGRKDRDADDKAKAEDERQKQIGGLMGQLFGQQPAGGGVAGNFAPTNPAQTAAPAASPFEEAFGPGEKGGGDAPVAAPSAAPVAPTQAPRRPDPNVLAQLIVLDHETGSKIASAFKTLDEMQLKQIEARNSHMGAAARYIQQGKTSEERQQRFQIAVPSLLEAGYTPQELEGIDNDLSDQRLQFYQATAIDYDKMIDNELAERKFQAGDNVAVVPGGNVANIKPTGEASWVVGGGPPTGQPESNPSADIPADAINDLKSGRGSAEQFDAIFGPGAAERVLGGGAGNGAGGFPQ